MKKFCAILSAVIGLTIASATYANYPVYDCQCVGRCEDPCVGKCESTCGRFYVGAFGGANWLQNSSMHGFKLKSKTGFTGAASLGYKFDNGFRVEGEVGYRRNRLDAKDRYSEIYSSEFGSDHKRPHGSHYTWSYMANFLYDFDEVSCYIPNVVPYVGFGLGYAQSHTHLKGHDGYAERKGKETERGFAYQGIAGVGYRLTDSTTLAVEYRYFDGKNHSRDHGVGLALRQSF